MSSLVLLACASNCGKRDYTRNSKLCSRQPSNVSRSLPCEVILWRCGAAQARTTRMHVFVLCPPHFTAQPSIRGKCADSVSACSEEGLQVSWQDWLVGEVTSVQGAAIEVAVTGQDGAFAHRHSHILSKQK
eukprot:5073789-Amphidinium_carterae.1